VFEPTTHAMNAFALLVLVLLSCMAALSSAFVNPAQRFHGVVQRPGRIVDTVLSPPSSVAQKPWQQQQRKSVASVVTMGLFGLGAPEIAVILVAAAFLLGPQKLAELGRDAGKVRDESTLVSYGNAFSHVLLVLLLKDCW
jgi:mttA/Hcf106 family